MELKICVLFVFINFVNGMIWSKDRKGAHVFPKHFKKYPEKFKKFETRGTTISEEVRKEVARLNGQIDAYKEGDLIGRLKNYNLSSDGNLQELRYRMKAHYVNINKASSNILSSRKLIPYYVVIDFEATCDVYNPRDYDHEIIEFPAVLINTEKQTIVDSFQLYVKPMVNPFLTAFCTRLTGITQDKVEKAKQFPVVLKKFEAWLQKHELGTKHNYAFVTDSPWDMNVFLKKQCEISGIPFPQYGKQWVNLKKIFLASYKRPPRNVEVMLRFFGMKFEGRRHCGLDDATNIGRLLLYMIKDGNPATINEYYNHAFKSPY